MSKLEVGTCEHAWISIHKKHYLFPYFYCNIFLLRWCLVYLLLSKPKSKCINPLTINMSFPVFYLVLYKPSLNEIGNKTLFVLGFFTPPLNDATRTNKYKTNMNIKIYMVHTIIMIGYVHSKHEKYLLFLSHWDQWYIMLHKFSEYKY